MRPTVPITKAEYTSGLKDLHGACNVLPRKTYGRTDKQRQVSETKQIKSILESLAWVSKQEQMLKQSVFVILTRLLHSLLSYILTNTNIRVMQHYNIV